MSLDTKNSLGTKSPTNGQPDMAMRWGGRLLFLTAILVISNIALQPGHSTPPNLFGSDKLSHMVAFLTLAGLSRLGWPTQSKWITGGLLLIYGFGIEFMQSTQMVGRTASWSDVVADIIGIGIGFLVFKWLGKIIRPAL